MLEHLFGSKTRLKILQLFFREPAQVFYGREMARRLGTHLNAVRRELGHLKALGLLVPADAASYPDSVDPIPARSKLYRLNPGALLYQELQALLIKARVMEEEALVEYLKEKAGKISLFLLTGIFAGDQDAPTDMVLVGHLHPQTIARAIKQYEAASGRSLRYTLLTEAEFKERRHVGDRFLYNLFEAKHRLAVNHYQIS